MIRAFIPRLMRICFSIIWLCLLFGSSNAYAQEKEKQEIEIIQAEKLRFTDRNDVKTYLLSGAVILQQGKTTLYCDSAYLFPAWNLASAFGHVHINQSDSVHAYGDSATYDGNARIARLYQNVRLTDRAMILTTDFLTYDMENRIGIYTDGGELRNQEAVLTSDRGYYYSISQDAFFRGDVRLKHPQYRLEADTLQYNTGTEVAWFHGPTTIYNENSTVYCEDGYYETISGIAVFNEHVQMDNPPQELQADSIFYNRETGLGKAFGNIFFRDTSQNILQYSEVALYDEVNGVITSTERSMAGYILDNDTLFIAGDTIRIVQDSLNGNTMYAYPNVRMYKEDFQGVCDSLYYSDADSIIRLFGMPLLWSDSTQFSGDTIQMQLEANTLREMYFYSNAMIVNEDDSLIYNQIKGRQITGYFQDGDLYKVSVRGNGESIYFGKDEQDRYLGVNQAVCSDIDLYIRENQFRRISFRELPEATFSPMQQIDPASFRLDGFRWAMDLRPTGRDDLFRETISDDQAGEEETPSMDRSSQKDG